jgi:hypothetical protein
MGSKAPIEATSSSDCHPGVRLRYSRGGAPRAESRRYRGRRPTNTGGTFSVPQDRWLRHGFPCAPPTRTARSNRRVRSTRSWRIQVPELHRSAKVRSGQRVLFLVDHRFQCRPDASFHGQDFGFNVRQITARYYTTTHHLGDTGQASTPAFYAARPGPAQQPPTPISCG